MLCRLLLSLLCAGALWAPVAAHAHAHLDRSSPARGSVLAEAPKDVTIWFTEAVEPKFSTIEVRDAKGTVMQSGPVEGVGGNTAQLRVPLKPLSPGAYTVEDQATTAALFLTGKGNLTRDFMIDIAGTPCEAVVSQSHMVHYPDHVIHLYPENSSLKAINASSFI